MSTRFLTNHDTIVLSANTFLIIMSADPTETVNSHLLDQKKMIGLPRYIISGVIPIISVLEIIK